MMKLVIWVLVGALLIFHQDFWNWHNSDLYLGFIPVGLLYHIGISLAAAVVWWLACTFAWPEDLHDEFESKGETQ